MTTGPHAHLAMAVAAQAVEDVKMLMKNGIIRPGGRVLTNDEWPKKHVWQNKKRVTVNVSFKGISKPYQAQQLLRWLKTRKGHLPLYLILELPGSNLTQEDICKKLGISSWEI